jgi:hypothetical protein
MEELVIKFGDPASMAAAVPVVSELIDAAQRALVAADEKIAAGTEERRHAESDLKRWQGLAEALRGMLPATPDPVSAEVLAEADNVPVGELPDSTSSKDTTLRVLTLINGPATTADVAMYMPEFSQKTVGWALWKLESEGAIQKLRHGAYAPLGYREGQVTTNYFEAARLGFPTPAAHVVKARTQDEMVERALQHNEQSGA